MQVVANANKRMMTLDLKKHAAVEIGHRLVRVLPMIVIYEYGQSWICET